MAVSSESDAHLGQPEDPNHSDPTTAHDDLDDFESEIEEDDDESEEDDEEPEPITPEAQMRTERVNMESLFKRLSTERVPVRVHDILIKGNTKTKDSVIEAEVEALLKNATTVQQLLQAAGVANARLQHLDIFDSVNITLDAGPPELPGTANVVVEVSEAKNPLTGDVGIFSKPEVTIVGLKL
ncbi:sorting and assembly machinery component 50 homolog B-like [Olea europaea subsp. europaea]|uniref:Sorting and assembly machinery component 50 homolog B-like n=1 Tax=Olea europaea subsp. europaea TaxID=158383 RepID=A0A8S0TWU3_OLEEU|nr:sorting and assembly machinery component 50 homolog B-like [Olea europaea subsp. europaea]